jgi:hypothetical protein
MAYGDEFIVLPPCIDFLFIIFYHEFSRVEMKSGFVLQAKPSEKTLKIPKLVILNFLPLPPCRKEFLYINYSI